MLFIEQWKNVVGYEGRYQVSNCGSVRSLPRPWRKQLLVLKLGKDSDGYRQAVLHKNGQKTTRKVHQLVLEAFVRQRHDGAITRHLDGNRTNNHIDNLKWGTPSENAHDAVAHGTSYGLNSFGTNNGNSKLTESDVSQIKRLLRDGQYEQQKIAKMFGVCKQTITFIKLKQTWKHVEG